MATNEEMSRAADVTLDAMRDTFIEKSPLMLEVEVTDRDAAEELMRWMYSKTDSPMKATLKTISWDATIVSKQEAEAVKMIHEGDAYVRPEDRRV